MGPPCQTLLQAGYYVIRRLWLIIIVVLAASGRGGPHDTTTPPPFVGELQGCLQLCPDTINHYTKSIH